MSNFNLAALTAPISSKTRLNHAVMQSIYNHGESTKNDRARMGSSERGGCWSDELISKVASRDWTLTREKLTTQTISLAKRFYDEALAWLIKDGHVKAIDVSVWEEKPNQMNRNIIITLNDSSKFEVSI